MLVAKENKSCKDVSTAMHMLLTEQKSTMQPNGIGNSTQPWAGDAAVDRQVGRVVSWCACAFVCS